MIVILFVTFAGGVYNVAHFPSESVHEDDANTPRAPLSLHITVPTGVFCELVVSFTVTESGVGDPGDNVAGFGRIVEIVVLGVKVAVEFIDTDDVLELA
jgi:hypothetical protein